MRLPLPAAAEFISINLVAGKFAGQRKLAGEVNRVIKSLQNRAYLNVVELRLKRSMRRLAARVQRAGKRKLSAVQLPLHLADGQQPLLVADIAFNLSKIHAPPLQLVRRQGHPRVKTAQ